MGGAGRSLGGTALAIIMVVVMAISCLMAWEVGLGMANAGMQE